MIVGALMDWPLRITIPIMAANISPLNTPFPWPVHIYKSPGCVATTIGYALTSISVWYWINDKVIAGSFPFQSLQEPWFEFSRAREEMMLRPIPEKATNEDRVRWSAEVITMYRNLLDRVVPPLKTSIYSTMSTSLSSLAHAVIIWPLRRIVTWMSVQSIQEIQTLAQNPVRIFNSMVQAEGSILKALYGGFHIYAFNSICQFGLGLLAGSFASMGINHIHRELTRFMDYQQRHNKIWNKNAASIVEIHESILTAGLGTLRIGLPVLYFLGTITSLIASRFVVAFPLSLLATVRILENCPSLPPQSYLVRYASRMTDLELLGELITSPLRSALFSWTGYHWKWFMLSAIFSPLGLYTTADLELR